MASFFDCFKHHILMFSETQRYSVSQNKSAGCFFLYVAMALNDLFTFKCPFSKNLFKEINLVVCFLLSVNLLKIFRLYLFFFKIKQFFTGSCKNEKKRKKIHQIFVGKRVIVHIKHKIFKLVVKRQLHPLFTVQCGEFNTPKAESVIRR